MKVWISLILLSAITGAVPSLFIRSGKTILVGAAVPWFGLLACLLYNEYCLPHQGGGASMQPVAQLVGGSFAAGIGAVSAWVVNKLRER